MTDLARSLADNTTLNPPSVSSLTSVLDQKSGSAVAIKNIVLVHGAFADGTSWYKVTRYCSRWATTLSPRRIPCFRSHRKLLPQSAPSP
jgi:hypothetical protein